MTDTDQIPPPMGAALAGRPPWEPCDHCQAPLDERQRYCVACGARRPHGDDPVARYFAANARRARAEEAGAPQGRPPSRAPLAVALALALLPVAAAAGVMVGRGGADQSDALVRALNAQKAPIVNVMGAGAGGTASDASRAGAEPKATRGTHSGDAHGKVIARTRYGTARQLTGASVTARQLEESRRAIDHIVNSRGRAYVEQQRRLPDQIVIP